MNKKMMVIIFIVLAIFIILLSIKWLKPASSLKKEDVQALLQSKYNGEITDITESENNDQAVYHAYITNEKGNYIVSVKKKTGEIASLTKISSPNDGEDINLIARKEAEKLVKEEDLGEILSISELVDQQGDFFLFIIKKNKKKHAYLINRESKEITLQNIKEGGNVYITEEKAKEMALKEVNGVISDIDLEEDNNKLVYEIEIETTNKKEVKIIINAYTGSIESISWEDD